MDLLEVEEVVEVAGVLLATEGLDIVLRVGDGHGRGREGGSDDDLVVLTKDIPHPVDTGLEDRPLLW